jgi:hypothetical protein
VFNSEKLLCASMPSMVDMCLIQRSYCVTACPLPVPGSKKEYDISFNRGLVSFDYVYNKPPLCASQVKDLHQRRHFQCCLESRTKHSIHNCMFSVHRLSVSVDLYSTVGRRSLIK